MPDFKSLPSQPTLGIGCWAIGGPFFSTDGVALGWGEVDDTASKRAIDVALDHGVVHFDTAQAYGAGHSESVLGEALKGKDVAIATKVGLELDSETKTLIGPLTDPAAIRTSLEGSLQRLGRDHIDLALLHLNVLDHETAEPIFEVLGRMVEEGSLGAIGWSTDFPENIDAFADLPAFTAIEHAKNVLLPATNVTQMAEDKNLLALIRSPLAMGLLGGKYDASSRFGKDDIRNKGDASNIYFKDGKITETALDQLTSVREVLTSDGRSLAQGAIAWLWAHSSNSMPIPGVRTPQQAEDLCGALALGSLTADQMQQIEDILDRPDEGEAREL